MNRLLCLSTTMLFLINITGCDNGIDLRSEFEKLPPRTKDGKNTFGCLVNGKAWVVSSTTDVTAFYQMNVFQLNAAIEEKNRHQAIGLALLGGLSEGSIYDLTNDPQSQAVFGWERVEQYCVYDIDKTTSGWLSISTLNESKAIISGTFEFVTITPGCDTLSVADGRFDLLYAN